VGDKADYKVLVKWQGVFIIIPMLCVSLRMDHELSHPRTMYAGIKML